MICIYLFIYKIKVSGMGGKSFLPASMNGTGTKKIGENERVTDSSLDEIKITESDLANNIFSTEFSFLST